MFGPRVSIIFVPTVRCNCDCAYCFQERSHGSISLREVSTVFGRVAAYLGRSGVKNVGVWWQGGEVLVLSPAWCLEAGRTITALMRDRGIKVKHSLQTNLMDYTPRWDAALWELFGGVMGSSLDFPNMHRRYRALAGDAYNQHWAGRFREASARGLSVQVISVPNRRTLEVSPVDFYRYYVEQLGLHGIQVNMPFAAGPSAEMHDELFLEPKRLGDFLKGLLAVYSFREDHVVLEPFQGIMDRVRFGDAAAKVPCFFCSNCVNSFFCIGPRSEVAQCDAWLGSYPERNFGSLLECEDLGKILTSPARLDLARRPARLIENSGCVSCEYFSLCGGGCPVRAMSATGCPDNKDPYCEAYKKMFAAIWEEVRSNSKHRRGWNAPAPQPAKSLEWGWPEPGAIVFSSFRCTNNCIFCAPAYDRSGDPEDLDREVYEFISRCAESGVRTLFFTGAGEPTLNPHLVEYVDHAKQSGIDNMYMFTNGFGITESLVWQLKNAGMENFWVSLHGLGETHDRIVRRKGSFVEAYRALSLINSAAPRHLNVNTCLNALNLDQIDRLLDKTLDFEHTSAHCLCLPEWDGNAYVNRSQMCRLSVLKERLSAITSKDYPITILDNIPHCIAPHLPHIGNVRNELRIKRRDEDNMVSNADNMGHNVTPQVCFDAGCPFLETCVGVDRRYLEEYGDDEIRVLIETGLHAEYHS